MQWHVYIHELALDEAGTALIQEYVQKRLGSFDRLVKRFESQGQIQAYVEISKPVKHPHQGKIYYAELTLHLPGQTLRVEEYAENANTAIDGLKAKLKKEFSRYKGVKILKRVKSQKREPSE